MPLQRTQTFLDLDDIDVDDIHGGNMTNIEANLLSTSTSPQPADPSASAPTVSLPIVKNPTTKPRVPVTISARRRTTPLGLHRSFHRNHPIFSLSKRTHDLYRKVLVSYLKKAFKERRDCEMTFAAAADARKQLAWTITMQENDLAVVDRPTDCTYCTVDECSVAGAPSDSKHPAMPIAITNMPKDAAVVYWASNSKLP